MARKHRKFSDQIRDAIRASGLSQYRVAKLVKIDESTMSRFMNAKTGLSLRTLDKMARHVGFRVVLDQKGGSRGQS